DGPVVDAAAADLAALRSGTVACIGTDQALVDLIPALVEAGCRVKLFEDRPRLVLSDAVILSGPAGLLAATATGVGGARQAGRGLPVPDGLCRAIDDEHARLQRWAGSLHRRRHLTDRWLRRQLTPRRGDDRDPLYGDGYYIAIGTGRCQLVSWPIARIT